MLTVQLALEAGGSLHDEKQALLDGKRLSLAVCIADSSGESIEAGVSKLLHAERILHLNEEELYFVEPGTSGPYSPRNELEALYHLHQLLTQSPNPSANQPSNVQTPQISTTSVDPLNGEATTSYDASTSLRQTLIDTGPQTVNSTSQNTQNPSRSPEVKGLVDESHIREAARAEVERRLIAYGAHKGAAEAGETCTGAAERDLMTWAKENGVISKVCAAAFPSIGRGAMAAVDIGVGEPVLDIPEPLIISGITAMASDMADAFSKIPDLDEDTAALLWTMRERHVADSHWAPFFRSLPSTFSTGLSFGPRAVRELEGTPAYEGVLAAQQHLKSQYAALFPALSDAFPEIFPASSFTWSDFLWAAELWYSYGIKVRFSDSHVRTALVPLVSLLNHATHPHVTHFSRVNPQTRKLRLPSLRPCRAGQQCFLSYGPLQPSDLLTFYGFTVDDNPYDAVQMGLELPDDELSAAKQALLAAWGLGLSHFLRGKKVPNRLHGALRVLLMDEDDLQEFELGDPRKSKVSNANEAAVIETLLSTVDALIPAAEEGRSQGSQQKQTDGTSLMGGTERTRADGIMGTEEVAREDGTANVTRAETTDVQKGADRTTRADAMNGSAKMVTSGRMDGRVQTDGRDTDVQLTESPSALSRTESTGRSSVDKMEKARVSRDLLQGDCDERAVRVARRYREQHITFLIQIRRSLLRMATENGFQFSET